MKVISAVGVNPEKSGYDTEYQCTGMYLANVYYDYCTDSTIKKELIAMTRAGLAWKSGEVGPDGTVSTIGDSRIGIETNRTGQIKEPTKGVTRGAFNQGYAHTGDAIDDTYATRIYDQGMPTDGNTVSVYGAVDGNEAWEHDKTLSWSIGGQQIAADYVEEGISQENGALIQQGLLIFHWGFAHQKGDGSFGTTEAPCAEPESGELNVTDQGVGMNFAQHYPAACTEPESLSAATAAANLGLVFEGQYVSAAGNIEQGAEPSLPALQRTFGMAESLPDGGYSTIVRARLGGLPTE